MLVRIFDIVLSLILLATSLPFVGFGATGIFITSGVPLLHCAKRTGRGGKEFIMLKLRTMHVNNAASSAITAPGDNRVFPFGSLLRALKIDELPQFWNVLRGDMAIVGPRPEDPSIVDRYYTPWMRETLDVRPGVTSPGSIFGYMYVDEYLDPDDPEISYVERLLPPKLAIERAYVGKIGLGAYLKVIWDTIRAIHILAADKTNRPLPSEIEDTKRWCGTEAFEPAESLAAR